MLTMITYLPYVIHFCIIHGGKPINVPHPARDTQLWVIFSKVHISSSVTFNSISIWLTVYLASFRYFLIRKISVQPKVRHSLPQNLFDMFKRKYNFVILVIFTIFIICFFLNLPVFLYSSIKEGSIELLNSSNITLSQEPGKFYYIDQSELNVKTNGLVFKLMFYIQGLVFKFIPCVILSIFTSLLINLLRIRNNKMKNVFVSSIKSENVSKSVKMQRAYDMMAQSYMVKPEASPRVSTPSKTIKEINVLEDLNNEENITADNQNSFGLQRMKNLDNSEGSDFGSNQTSSRANTSSSNTNYSIKHQARGKDWHVTLLLTVVCLFFVATEIPQSVLSILSIILDDWFYNDVYLPLGDLMDMFSLLNNSFMFILNCSMGIEFRQTLVDILKIRIPK